VRLVKIPDESPPGRYVVTMVARNESSGVQESWRQEVGEKK
jgi:hypothetical protein